MTKYGTRDGYSVEVVQLAGTSGNHDGQWLRVRYHGFYVADVRTVTELEKYFPLSELEEALPRPDVGGPRLGSRSYEPQPGHALGMAACFTDYDREPRSTPRRSAGSPQQYSAQP
jgi:hypothetical protein